MSAFLHVWSTALSLLLIMLHKVVQRHVLSCIRAGAREAFQSWAMSPGLSTHGAASLRSWTFAPDGKSMEEATEMEVQQWSKSHGLSGFDLVKVRLAIGRRK